MPAPARRLARLAITWSLVADAVPLYALYALLFAHAGLSVGQISGLFAVWSATAILAEIPAGALADRFSRRGALVAAGVLQAGGYALWIARPGFPGFADGFVLWGLGGALKSGAFEALLYEGLAAAGAADHYPRVLGRVTAVGLFAQLPGSAGAALLYSIGGFPLVGWVSVGYCLVAAGLAGRLPEPPRPTPPDEPTIDPTDDPTDSGSYLATLRTGLVAATARPMIRAAVTAVAVLTGFDAVDEYFPLLARDWGVPTALTPIAVVGIPLAGAAGAALGGAARRLGRRRLALVMVVAAIALGAASLLHRPGGLALVAVFYGLYQLALVVVDARLQELIDGPTRATVTSVAAVGTEVAVFGFYGAWALGGALAAAALFVLVAAALPRLMRPT